MKFEQIYLKADSEKAEIFLNLPAMFDKPKHLGTLYRQSKTLRMVPKSTANLFRIFNALGMNEEAILKLNFEFVEVDYCNRILRTTKKHFLKHSIRSPYQNNKVDRQLLLDIDEWIIPEEPEPEEIELSLFEV
jgi:hypothetical protein